MKKLKGIVCATITPMTKNGDIDEVSLRKLCNYLANSGINGIYPNGTNGEGILLTKDERQEISKIMVEENCGRMSAYIQSAAATTEETVSHIEHAVEIGADGVGIMTPIFFKCDDIALEQYFDRTISTAGDLPVYIYNIPSHSHNDISPNLLAKLVSKHQNLMGIKYSDSNLMRIEDYLRESPRPIDLLIGCDSLVLPTLAIGGVGTVSGPAMVFSKWFTKLYKEYLEGDYEKAAQTQKVIVDADRMLQDIPGIPAIKAMLKMLGVIENDICRMPLRSLSKEEYLRIEKILNEIVKGDD